MHLAAGNTSLRCDYCKTVVVLPTDNAGIQFIGEVTTDLNCPVCAVKLWDAVIAGVQINACNRCHGTLIRMGALETVIDQLRSTNIETQVPAPPNPDDLRRKLDCPKCRQHMDVHFYMGGGGAVIGGCERCELDWLDGGAIMRIVRAPHHDDSAMHSW